MKKIYLLLFIITSLYSFGQVTITPNPFEVDESITITLDINSNASNCNGYNNWSKVYMHSGVGDGSNAFGISVVGNWGMDDGVGEMTNNGGGIYSITLTPETYYGLSASQASNVVQMGMVFRNANGSQEIKANGCTDFIFEVGTFQVSLVSPQEDNTILVSGSDFEIETTNIGGNATYTLYANGALLDSNTTTNNYTYTDLAVTENTTYELVAELNGTIITKTFSVLIDPGSNIGIMPTNYEDGITYIDDNTAILVLYATGKDFVYLAGSFNNYQPDATYAMKKDPTRNNKFWIELTGLTPGQVETYQYWVADKTPLPNSPALVKTADPYSTLVLSPFDDPFISSETYPNLPSYPVGQDREVTVLQTGQTPYNWQVTDFEKPKKEDLIVYELLVRDFDADRNYQDIIDRIDYFKNLNINAIELMPVMEFEGNESWGYNTSFHMALDKFYGTEEKFKELIDVCHQNGIAVILDVALNHAFGRNPMVRMWMNDPDGDGWGEPSSDNPYFNEVAQHSYSVGSDYDHSNPRTRDYTKRVVKHWIEEFNIDGFRWDLTKGFTQNCENNEGCTNQYQQDRVDILKEYADYSWSLDPDHYVIFEHLGSETEEKEWANYRFDEGKGIMMWGKMTDPYNELTMGQNGNKNINGIGHNSRPQFDGPRVIGYPESHDEERLMYKNLQFGNTSNASHNIQNLNVAISRMSAMAAVSVMVPGPKMIWHFGELGMENSIFTCNNGTVNLPGDTDGNGDCKLDTKPQPQWANNWLSDAVRGQVYEDWSILHKLKTEEPVFEGDYTMTSGDFTPRIDIFDTSIPSTELRNVIILANFDVNSQTVNTNFPTGVTTDWFDLMDPTGNTTVSNSTTSITIPAGQFRILGNQPSQVLSVNEEVVNDFKLYPNPANTDFSININASQVEIFDLTGKRVKSFKGNFSRTDLFDISSLKTGIYMVKIENENAQIKTTKLVKL